MAEKETSFRLKVITPDRIFYENPVTMMELNTVDGEIGVLPGHISLTSIVAPGILRIHEEDGTKKEASLLSGFLEILPDQVTVLAEACEWPDEIDLHRAEEARIRAERRLKMAEADQTRAEAALARALVRIQLADKK